VRPRTIDRPPSESCFPRRLVGRPLDLVTGRQHRPFEWRPQPGGRRWLSVEQGWTVSTLLEPRVEVRILAGTTLIGALERQLDYSTKKEVKSRALVFSHAGSGALENIPSFTSILQTVQRSKSMTASNEGGVGPWYRRANSLRPGGRRQTNRTRNRSDQRRIGTAVVRRSAAEPPCLAFSPCGVSQLSGVRVRGIHCLSPEELRLGARILQAWPGSCGVSCEPACRTGPRFLQRSSRGRREGCGP
jgi:hypothetical protein